MSSLCCCCKSEKKNSGFLAPLYNELTFLERYGCMQGTLVVTGFALIIAGLALTGFDIDKTTVYAVMFSGVGLIIVFAFMRVYIANCYRPFSTCPCCGC